MAPHGEHSVGIILVGRLQKIIVHFFIKTPYIHMKFTF